MTPKQLARFEAKVERITESGCWIWMGATNKCDGYGHASIDGRFYVAHRLAYEHFVGPIGEGLRVLHRCDCPPCVNPTHLFQGTDADNVNDCKAKRRNMHGMRHWNAKLSAADVAEIRRTFAAHAGSITHRELAERFGVLRPAISKILNGERWMLPTP